VIISGYCYQMWLGQIKTMENDELD